MPLYRILSSPEFEDYLKSKPGERPLNVHLWNALTQNRNTSELYEIESETGKKICRIIYQYTDPTKTEGIVTNGIYKNRETRQKLNRHLLELLDEAEKFTGGADQVTGLAIVDSKQRYGMTNGHLGLHIDQIAIDRLVAAIDSGDSQRIKAEKAHIGSSLAHEITHLVRDETLTKDGVEIPTHVVQFLYDPQNNMQFGCNLERHFDNAIQENRLEQMAKQSNSYPRETYMAMLLVANTLQKISLEFKTLWEDDPSPNKRNAILRMPEFITGEVHAQLASNLLPYILDTENYMPLRKCEDLKARAEAIYASASISKKNEPQSLMPKESRIGSKVDEAVAAGVGRFMSEVGGARNRALKMVDKLHERKLSLGISNERGA